MANVATVLDRYIAFTDRVVAGTAELGQLRELFAPDATVRIFADPISGIEEIVAFYAGFLGQMEECKHFWKVSRNGNDLLEAEWVAAVRLKDGTLISSAGFETARINGHGQISELCNRPRHAGAGDRGGSSSSL